MNKVILFGRLTRDPEVRYSQAAEPLAVCRFSVAVKREFAKEGDITADFINCVAFGKKGEVIGRYFHKGSRIALTGRLQVSQYKDKNGNNRYSTDVIVIDMEFVDTKEESGMFGSNSNNSAEAETAGAAIPNGFSIDNEYEDDVDEDIPF